jgi:hypothetical protein
MNNFIFKTLAIVVASLLLLTGCNKSSATASQTAVASHDQTTGQSTAQTNAGATLPASDQKYTDAELDEMLAPVALYPDPLLAQMIPAATFFDQLEEAQRTLNGKSDDDLIANQNWEVSVKSVAHYPQVLQLMVENQDRTVAIGQAYVTQPDDVGKSIQRLRAEARDAGNLVTTKQQQVVTEGEAIKIEPAQPQVIYVPQYDPEVVYVDNGPSTGAVVAASVISFGAGLAIGAWLNNDYDYYGRGIYYHGWNGGGWIGANRTFVNVNRNVYINNSYRNINVNRNIVNRNISTYRTNLNRSATVRRERVDANRIARNNRSIDERNKPLNNRGAVNGERVTNRATTTSNRRATNTSTRTNRNTSANRSMQNTSGSRTAQSRSTTRSRTKTRSSGGGVRRH